MNVNRPIKHGTIGGYQAHRRRDEAACNSCLTAWRIYYQKREGTVSRKVYRLRLHEAKAARMRYLANRANEYAERRRRRAERKAEEQA